MEENQISESSALERGELEQPPEDHPMNALMEGALSFRILKRGDIVNGIIVSVTPTEVLVDVSAKSEGVVPSKELERLGREGLESLQVGDTLPVYVVRPEDRDGNLVLSIRRAEEEGDWQKAEALFEATDSFEGQVAGFNKGGLIVRLGRLRGFVPASQLSPQHQGSNKQQPEERWARLVGVEIRVKVIEINRKRRRLILSERAALRQWRDVQKEVLLEELRVGEVREGTVSSLSDFGAFIDLGGADGLVHLSELSWNRAVQPRDVLRVGQKVEVYVLNVDREKKRIALSLKRLEPEPWTTVESRYYVGQLVEGTITRLANFGAFALVNDEIEGLIHISELSVGRINHPREVVQEREKHVMRIIRIDPRKRRMGLSLKRVADPAYADLDWRAELADVESELESEEAVEDLQESGTLVGAPLESKPLEADVASSEEPESLAAIEEIVESEEELGEPIGEPVDELELSEPVAESEGPATGEEIARSVEEPDASVEADEETVEPAEEIEEPVDELELSEPVAGSEESAAGEEIAEDMEEPDASVTDEEPDTAAESAEPVDASGVPAEPDVVLESVVASDLEVAEETSEPDRLDEEE